MVRAGSAAATTPLKWHAFTWNFPKKYDGNQAALDGFKKANTAIGKALKKVGAARWIFQLELTYPLIVADEDGGASTMSASQIDSVPGSGSEASSDAGDEELPDWGDDDKSEFDDSDDDEPEGPPKEPHRLNWHYQGYVEMGSKMRAVTLGSKLGPKFGGIQVTPASLNGRKRLKSYCMKDATRQAGPWADRPLSEVEAEIDAEVEMTTDQLKDHFGLKLENLNACQQDVVHRVSAVPTRGTVDVLCDPIGNMPGVAKSTAAEYCSLYKNSWKFGWASARHLKAGVARVLNKKAYFFDLARSGGGVTKFNQGNSQEAELWTAVEEIKGYRIFIDFGSDTRSVITKPCHVFVMTNKSPSQINHRMSSGRLVFWVPKLCDGVYRWVTKLADGSYEAMHSKPPLPTVPFVFPPTATDDQIPIVIDPGQEDDEPAPPPAKKTKSKSKTKSLGASSGSASVVASESISQTESEVVYLEVPEPVPSQ